MPHKINPINFENAEGNLQLANSLLEGFIRKLPISRMQRDLSDSTVLRNIGLAFGYILVAVNSLTTGLSKLKINNPKLEQELEQHWEILAEPLQTVLRKHFISQAYEKLQEVSQGFTVDNKGYHRWVKSFVLPPEAQQQLLNLSPDNYIGTAKNFDLKPILDSLK